MSAGRLVSQFLCALAVLLILTRLHAADAPPPRVIGFERFHAQGDDVAGGQLLLGELNCTSCHQADDSLASHIQRKPAPVLDTVMTRVKPQYLLKFLADPQATKPSTTMPNVLAHLPEAERGPIVEALVHFLATTGERSFSNPLRQAVNRGDALYHAVGCVACHDQRKDPSQPPLATSIPIGTPSRKYTLPGLTQFLSDPLAVRPGGRMPHLNLTATDATAIASYLMNDLDIASGLQFAYYEGSWDKLPDFTKLTPKEVGDASNFDVSVAKRTDNFGLRFDGTIRLDKDGDYLFLIGSDDGSRLLIDDKVIVANDGIHPFEQKRKKVKMTAGTHTVTVEYFEQGGEEVLQVDFEAPGSTQQPLASIVAAQTPKGSAAPADQQFVVDPSLAAKGKEYFATLGCASCHTLKKDGQTIASKFTASKLSELKAAGGCLDDNPAKAPRYALGTRQKQTLVAALAAAKQPAAALPPAEFIARTMVRFNCYACHERDKIGGVEEARNPHFQSDMPEMGDEGRIPPHLTGVGGKLNAAWLKTLFDQGAKDRPYMFTRMPKFGLANVGELLPALEKADAGTTRPLISTGVDETDKRFKAAGRRLVGGQGFGCIKCHTFADKRSTGIQALSLTTMTRRLRREWFNQYMRSPLAWRPGTRMPTSFPNGQTTLPDLLDGSVDKQLGAMWAFLEGGDQAQLPIGLVTGQMEVIAYDEAVVYRNFIEGAGHRAIGVGYPQKLNLAFDANQMRLAMIWQGGFIDAAKHWTARGAGSEKPLGDNALNLVAGVPFAQLDDSQAPWPSKPAKEQGYQFRGYKLGEKMQPTFLYRFGDIEIEDTPKPVGEQDYFVFERTLTLSSPQPPTNFWFRAATGKIEEIGNGAYKLDKLTLKVAGKGRPPELRQAGGTIEVLVPVVFEDGRSQIKVTYDW